MHTPEQKPKKPFSGTWLPLGSNSRKRGSMNDPGSGLNVMLTTSPGSALKENVSTSLKKEIMPGSV